MTNKPLCTPRWMKPLQNYWTRLKRKTRIWLARFSKSLPVRMICEINILNLSDPRPRMSPDSVTYGSNKGGKQPWTRHNMVGVRCLQCKPFKTYLILMWAVIKLVIECIQYFKAQCLSASRSLKFHKEALVWIHEVRVQEFQMAANWVLCRSRWVFRQACNATTKVASQRVIFLICIIAPKSAVNFSPCKPKVGLDLLTWNQSKINR